MGIFSHGRFVAVLQYFTKNIDDYWHILYPITMLKDLEEDKYLYFYDISRKATDYKGEFFEDEIYMFLGYDGKYHIHALEIAQYSLACWIAWRKTKDKIWAMRALKNCGWLIKNQSKNGSFTIKHKNPIYDDLPNAWSSSLAQGVAISSLVRGYFYTGEKKYLEAAIKACDFLELDIKEHGVKRFFQKKEINGFIYEEYPLNELNGVLNGYISSIIGIFELSEIDTSKKELFLKNIKNLKKIVPLYDCGYWSYYSLNQNLSSGFYHRYIILQLRAMGRFDLYFEKYAMLFESYIKKRHFALFAFLQKSFWSMGKKVIS